MELSSSTTLAGDPAAGPLAAVDGNPATTWIADVTDAGPTLRLRWQGARNLTGLRLRTDETSGAARPVEVVLSTPFTTQTVALDEQGRAPIHLVTDQVDVHLVAPAPRPNDAGITWPAGTTGITELSLDGAGDLLGTVGPDTPFTVPCGFGPPVTVDDFQYATSTTTASCGSAPARTARAHEVHGGESASFVVQDLWLRPVAASWGFQRAGAAAGGDQRCSWWGAGDHRGDRRAAHRHRRRASRDRAAGLPARCDAVGTGTEGARRRRGGDGRADGGHRAAARQRPGMGVRLAGAGRDACRARGCRSRPRRAVPAATGGQRRAS
ncbi:MAG: hypothetical protein GEV04_10810 [Actinophytocola sp.]|nr:hypothetical protein [Actinophytocola sp.]